MANTLLITAQEVIDLSFSERTNFKAAKIRDNIISAAQEEWIRPVLSDGFYYKLLATTGTLDESHTELLENYVKPCLAFYVKYLALPDIENPTTNKGSQELYSENSKGVSEKEKATKRNGAKDIGDTLAGVLKRFIENNLDIFVMYEKENNVLNRVTIRGGIILRKSKVYLKLKALENGYNDSVTINKVNEKTYEFVADVNGFFQIDYSDIEAVGEHLAVTIMNSQNQLINEYNVDMNYDTESQVFEAWINTGHQADYSGTITITISQ
jgi:hypothetical protein